MSSGADHLRGFSLFQVFKDAFGRYDSEVVGACLAGFCREVTVDVETCAASIDEVQELVSHESSHAGGASNLASSIQKLRRSTHKRRRQRGELALDGRW